MKREMSVSGSFYPARAEELQRYFEHFTKVYSEENISLYSSTCKSVIVPHAGYIYSGYTANIAYKLLQQSVAKEFLIIGPSHKVAFNGVSVCKYESYKTPFEDIKRAESLYDDLLKNFRLTCREDAHFEHSTEVQFPFIKYYLPDVSIVELVYSQIDSDFISKIIDFVLSQKDYGVIISTDLSHFYNLNDANKLDNICLDAVEDLDVDKLNSGCEACGKTGIEAMMKTAKKLGLNSNILDYRTSADVSDDSSRVVGYMSAYFE